MDELYLTINGIPIEFFKQAIPEVSVSKNHRLACVNFDDYCRKNRNDIVKAFKQNGRLEVWTRYMTVVRFMSENEFERWCIGRTYKILGRVELFRSGSVIKGTEMQ